MSQDGTSSEDSNYCSAESWLEKKRADNKKLAWALAGLEASRKRELNLAHQELLRLTAEYSKTKKAIAKVHHSSAILKRAHKWGNSIYKEVRANTSKCRKIYQTIADNLKVARRNITICDLIYANHYEETLKKVHEYKTQSARVSTMVKNDKEHIKSLRNEIEMEKMKHKKKLLELEEQKSKIVSKYGNLSVRIEELNDELAKQKEKNAGIVKNIQETESVNLIIQAEINKVDSDMEKTENDMTSMQMLHENNAALLTREGAELDIKIQKKLDNISQLEKEIHSLGEEKDILEEENVNLSAMKEISDMECAEIEALINCEEDNRLHASHRNQLRSQELYTIIKALEDEQKLIMNELLNKTKLVQSLTTKVQKDEETNHNLECDIAEIDRNLVSVKVQIDNDKMKYEHMFAEFKNSQQELDKSIEKGNKLDQNVKSSNEICESEILRLTNECRAIEMDIESQPIEFHNISRMLDAEEKEQATKDKLSIEAAEAELSDLREQLEVIESETTDIQESFVPLEVEYNVMSRKVNTLQESNNMKKRALEQNKKPKPAKIPQRAERNGSSSSIEAPSIWEFEQMRMERQNKKKLLRKKTRARSSKVQPGSSKRE